MPELSYNAQERIARQLESIEGRFEELSIRITLPEVISDSALCTRPVSYTHLTLPTIFRV